MSVLILFPLLLLALALATARLVPTRPSAPASLRWALRGLLGFLILTILSTTHLLLGTFTLPFVAASLVSLPLLTMFVPRGKGLDLRGVQNSQRSASPTKMEFLLLFASAAVLLHTLLCALTPEVRTDPLKYHLRLAQQYAVRGGIEPLRENPWWAIPQYGESLYALGILLWNDTLAKLLHWSAGALCALGVFAFTQIRFGTGPACWAIFIWLTTPKVSYEMTTTYVEMTLTVWVFASILFGSHSLRPGNPIESSRCLVASAFFLGMAFGTKYTALAVQGLPWFLFPTLFFIRADVALNRRLLTLVLAAAALLLADSPWLVRNLHQTGNPIYPLYNSLLGSTDPVDRGIEKFFLTVWPGTALLQPRFYFERLLGLFHSGYSFPALAVLLPLALRLFPKSATEPGEWRFDAGDRSILLYCGLSFVCYLIFTGNMDGRFYLPTLALLVCYLAPMLVRILHWIPGAAWKGRAVGLAVALLFLFNYIEQRRAFFEDFEESPWPILRHEARWDYYARHEVGEPDGDFWERVIPENAFVYNIGFPYRIKAIHPLREVSFDESADPPLQLPTGIDPLIDPFEASPGTDRDLERIVQDSGVDFLLLPRDSHHRAHPFWRLASEVYPVVHGTDGRLLSVRRPSEQGSAGQANP